MKPVNRRRATMMTQEDLRYPLKLGIKEKGNRVRKSYPQVIKPLPLCDPLLPGALPPDRRASSELCHGLHSARLPQEILRINEAEAYMNTANGIRKEKEIALKGRICDQ